MGFATLLVGVVGLAGCDPTSAVASADTAVGVGDDTVTDTAPDTAAADTVSGDTSDSPTDTSCTSGLTVLVDGAPVDGVLAFDAFANRMMVMHPIPDAPVLAGQGVPRELTDADIAESELVLAFQGDGAALGGAGLSTPGTCPPA